MEVELFAEGVSEEDALGVDDHNDDYSTFEGERCGICMDIVIDRGVLDCCQHWFCFECIDNWATITNLCPLCQNEFQLITCVPVYDTIGSNNADDDLNSGDDDWCIEGKNNTLSFPSYYIDENLNSRKFATSDPGFHDRKGKPIPVSVKEGATVLLTGYGGTKVKLSHKERNSKST